MSVANHLFTVSDDVKNLPEERTQLFHHLKWTRQDIQTALAF